MRPIAFHWEPWPNNERNLDELERLDFMDLKEPYAQKTSVLFDILEGLYMRDDVSRASELIELLYWGTNNPSDIGIVTLWLQQIEVLAILKHLLGVEGLLALINNLVDFATSHITQYNIKNEVVVSLVRWVSDVDMGRAEKRQDLIRIVLEEESIIYVHPGMSIPYLNKKVDTESEKEDVS